MTSSVCHQQEERKTELSRTKISEMKRRLLHSLLLLSASHFFLSVILRLLFLPLKKKKTRMGKRRRKKKKQRHKKNEIDASVPHAYFESSRKRIMKRGYPHIYFSREQSSGGTLFLYKDCYLSSSSGTLLPVCTSSVFYTVAIPPRHFHVFCSLLLLLPPPLPAGRSSKEIWPYIVKKIQTQWWCCSIFPHFSPPLPGKTIDMKQSLARIYS